MKDYIIPVNNEAHSRALIAVVGEEQAQLVLKAYQLIDAAMVFGYEKSQAEEAEKRKARAEDYVEALQRVEERDNSEVYKQGYDAGFVAASNAAEDAEVLRTDAYDQVAYDDGYVDGVSDARTWPARTDENVARLCSMDDSDDGGPYNEPATYGTTDDFAQGYCGDSGDETDYPANPACRD